MILSAQHPRVILYRSPEPILSPMLHVERHGIVPNVVFPTWINRRDDVGSPDRFDVFYGMADTSTPVEQPTGPTQSHQCTATRVVCCVVCGIVVGVAIGCPVRGGCACRAGEPPGRE